MSPAVCALKAGWQMPPGPLTRMPPWKIFRSTPADLWPAPQRMFTSAATTIFILPPSTAELERRLRARGQDAEDVIQRRVAAALGEMRHVGEFDFVIINKDLQTASEDLAAVVRAARLRLTNQRAALPEMFHFLEQ